MPKTDISRSDPQDKTPFGIGYTAVSQAVSRLKREMEKDKKIKKIVQDIEKELLSED